jgi:hypothetical protein
VAVVAPVALLWGHPVRAQESEAYSHFWFLVDLAECGGAPCALVSPVFDLTARTPPDDLLREFQERTEERFHGVVPQPLVEPVGGLWRDEVEAAREERVDAWRRLGWTVYVVEVADRPTPDSLLFARAASEATALAEGYRAESDGALAVALLWYRRAAALMGDAPTAHEAIDRVEAEIRRLARTDTGSGHR